MKVENTISPTISIASVILTGIYADLWYTCTTQVNYPRSHRSFICMNDKSTIRRSCCPINYALEVLGDKWTLLVIRDLVFLNKRHFKDFQSSPESIATNILSNRLKSLENEGVITREKDPDNKRQIVYELTRKGIDLIPLLVEMILWGDKYDPECQAPAELMERLKTDPKAFIQELTQKHLNG